jgi:hypothetical protein
LRARECRRQGAAGAVVDRRVVERTARRGRATVPCTEQPVAGFDEDLSLRIDGELAVAQRGESTQRVLAVQRAQLTDGLSQLIAISAPDFRQGAIERGGGPRGEQTQAEAQTQSGKPTANRDSQGVSSFWRRLAT